MILPAYLEKEVEKYCEIRGIPFQDNVVSSAYVDEVKKFILQRLKKDRIVTKRQEEDKEAHIKATLMKLIGVEEPKISIEDYLRDALIRGDLYKDCKEQFEIGTKRVDFAFVKERLAVEADGKQYHFTEKWQIERDQKRDKYLARKGWRVLHIEGLAIRRNVGLCVEKIKAALAGF